MLGDFNFWLANLFQLFFLFVAFYGVKRDKQNASFMSRDYTSFMKALCCFSVILAHVGAGEKYCLLGCLHWIAVSCFFLFSAYGLSYNASRRAGYMKTFYRRLLKVIIPLLLVLGLKAAFSCSLWSGGMNYMLVISFFYLAFFIIRSACAKKESATLLGLDVADCMLIAFTLGYSLCVQAFLDSKMATSGYGKGAFAIAALLGWGCQSLGFAYGTVLSRKLEAFKTFLARRRNAVILFSICLGTLFILAPVYLKARDIYFVSWKEYGIRAALVLCALLLAALFSQGLSFGNPVIRFIGGISSEMFLLHGFVIEMLERWTGLCHRQPGIFVVLVYLLTFVLAIGLHYALKAFYRLLRI